MINVPWELFTRAYTIIVLVCSCFLFVWYTYLNHADVVGIHPVVALLSLTRSFMELVLVGLMRMTCPGDPLMCQPTSLTGSPQHNQYGRGWGVVHTWVWSSCAQWCDRLIAGPSYGVGVRSLCHSRCLLLPPSRPRPTICLARLTEWCLNPICCSQLWQDSYTTLYCVYM